MSLDRLGKDGVMQRIALTFALAGALALGACGGEASPKPAPLTETPTTSQAPTPPSTPTSLEGLSKRSAQSLITYYLSVLSYASVTGNVEPLRALGTDQCASCNGVIDEIKKTYASGGRVQGTQISVTAFDDVQSTATGFRIRASIRSAPELSFTAPSSSPSRNPGGASGLVFTLVNSDGRLLISGWTQAT